MATTREEIKSWLIEAQQKKCSHMIVAVDTYDYDDYPVFVLPGQDVTKVYKATIASPMQGVMEVYSLTGKYSIEEQLREHRAKHFD